MENLREIDEALCIGIETEPPLAETHEEICIGKRKHYDVSTDNSDTEKKCRFLYDKTCASASFAANGRRANASLHPDVERGLVSEKKKRRRKRGQRKNKTSENKIQTESPSRQLNENVVTKLISSQDDNHITECEHTKPISAMETSAEPFPLLSCEFSSKELRLVNSKADLEHMRLQAEFKKDKQIKPLLFTKPEPLDNFKSKSGAEEKGTCTPSSSMQEPKTDKIIEDLQPKSNDNKAASKSQSKLKPKRKIFIYGNYNRYYGYRSPELEEDLRLSCLPKLLFEEKEVLDIGCNIGHLTMLIARDFQPKRIIGLDIDGNLIAIAKKNIRRYIVSGGKKRNQSSDATVSALEQNLQSGNCNNSTFVNNNDLFPNNVMFMQGNYVLERDDLLDLQREEYDVILALSITKWIHLNFGDEGLKRTFKRIFCQLRPGGKLVLEPQEWSSYKKRKKLTERIFENFRSISFFPDQFQNYLLSKDVGFSSCEMLGVPNCKSKGFRRPLILFIKSSSYIPTQCQNGSMLQTLTSSSCEAYHGKDGTKSNLNVVPSLVVNGSNTDDDAGNAETAAVACASAEKNCERFAVVEIGHSMSKDDSMSSTVVTGSPSRTVTKEVVEEAAATYPPLTVITENATAAVGDIAVF